MPAATFTLRVWGWSGELLWFLFCRAIADVTLMECHFSPWCKCEAISSPAVSFLPLVWVIVPSFLSISTCLQLSIDSFQPFQPSDTLNSVPFPDVPLSSKVARTRLVIAPMLELVLLATSCDSNHCVCSHTLFAPCPPPALSPLTQKVGCVA